MVKRLNSYLYQHCVVLCNIRSMYSHRFAQRSVQSKNLKNSILNQILEYMKSFIWYKIWYFEPCTETTATNWNAKVILFLHLWNSAHWICKELVSVLLPIISSFHGSVLKKSSDIFSSNGSFFSMLSFEWSLSNSIDTLFNFRPKRHDSKNPTSFRKHSGSGFVSSKVP